MDSYNLTHTGAELDRDVYKRQDVHPCIRGIKAKPPAEQHAGG